MIQNIVIGTPELSPEEMFASSHEDWLNNEIKMTLFTEERNLPRLLVQLGVFPSTSEIRRNRRDLIVDLTVPEFREIKIGKRKFYILVGKL